MSNPHGAITCIVCLADKAYGEFVYITRDGQLVEYGHVEAWPCCKACWEKLGHDSAAVLERVAPFGFSKRPFFNHILGRI